MNIYYDIKEIREPKLEDGQVYIYVLENSPQHNIKIGQTTNPKQRMSSLSGSNSGGNRIERVAISPPTYLPFLEKICHKHFNRFRVKNTEYFENVTFEEVLWFLVSLFDEPSYASSNEMHKKQYLKEHQK